MRGRHSGDSGKNGSCRVLVVEDEAIIARDIRNILESLGFVVLDIAATGEEALRKTSSLKPDLVLMDIKLKGDMDGIKAGLEIRALYRIPIIFLTAYNRPFCRDDPRCFAMPQYPILSKPFDAAEILKAIDACVSHLGPNPAVRRSQTA